MFLKLYVTQALVKIILLITHIFCSLTVIPFDLDMKLTI
jgi:hypothetical protein